MNLKLEFAWTKWGPKDITRQTRDILAKKKESLAEIKNVSADKRTFENTVYAIEASDYHYGDTGSLIEFLMQVSPDRSVRDAANRAVKELQAKMLELAYDEGVYRALKEYTTKKEKLTGADKKLLRDILRAYRRMGFDLSSAKRRQLKQNLKILQKLETDFSKNINDYHDFITVTRKELKGLSDRYVSSLLKKGNSYHVSLKAMEYVPFVENADDAAKRAELIEKYLRKGGVQNLQLAKKILALRDRNAKLLGFKNHADYVNEIKMSKNAVTVQKFIERLVKKITPLVRKELTYLTNVKRTLTGESKARLEFYDTAYYINQDKKRTLKLDTEHVREYFPLETVTSGMFAIYSKLLGVNFERLSGLPAWHDDVGHYRVYEKNGTVGYFMLDLYPRANKFSHAAVWQLRSARSVGFRTTERVIPIAGMVTNFPKPTKTAPTLLSHDEVNTFFHEFGHVMHGLLSQTRYASQSGTSVLRDFVEAPSQMLENWVDDKKMLGILSGHYKNPKQKLPLNLLHGLDKAKLHMIGYLTMRQLIFSHFDLLVHTGKMDVATGYRKIVKQYTGINIPRTALFVAGFGHFAGYDAGYYGYLWSKVYSSDMFTRFKKEGLLNKKTGHDYRTWILEKGSSMEPMDLLKGFLGRTPNEKAFLKEIGLKA